MATVLNQLPASLRSESTSTRRTPGTADRPYLVPGKKHRAAWTSFIPHPKESEDARITGTTRSLDRRLMALNVSGRLPQNVRLPQSVSYADSRIA